MPVLVAVIVALALVGKPLRAWVYDSADLSTAGTVFAGVFVQALPFLALGVLLSAAIAVFLTPARLSRWLPRRPVARHQLIVGFGNTRSAIYRDLFALQL